MTTIKEYIELLKACSPDDVVVCDIWYMSDAISRAKDRGITLTPVESKRVLTLMEENHNCELGLTYDTLDCAIDAVVEER